jgi:putative ABC transport system permease protein
MRLIDILSLALGNLWQRKLRTCLNLLGIVIGCTVLLLTAAGTSGVKKAVQAIFDSSEFAKEILVNADRYAAVGDPPDGTIVVEGDMDPQRRERIRQALEQRWKSDQMQPQDWQISLADIESLKQIPHVARVVPESRLQCRLISDDKRMESNITGVDVFSPALRKKVIAGELLTDQSRGDVLVNEVLAYDLGFRSDAQLQELIGRELTVSYQIGGGTYGMIYQNLSYLAGKGETSLADTAAFAITFAQLVADLDKTSLSEQQKQTIRQLLPAVPEPDDQSPQTAEAISDQRTFRVRGIISSVYDSNSITDLFRNWFHDSHGDLFLHHEVATEMQSQIPERRDDYYSVAVIVDSSRHLKSVTEAIESQGLRANSAVDVLDSINDGIERSRWLVFGFAAAILLASALGISNTLVISVLQRTPEFGILKAVGARDRDLVLLMLCEGALLGLIGATLTLVIGWLLSYAGHGLMVRLMSREFGSQLPGPLFDFELWPILIMYAIAVVICVAASILPAWRAARLDPVVAMRRT